MKGWKRWSAAALLSATLWTGAFAATTSVEMLRDMFRLPVTEWQSTLRANSRLLNAEFFDNVGKRIRWGIENNHVDDAFRFAMVGDFSAQAVNKPDNFRIDLAELFFKAQNFQMAGQICDNIRITSPDSQAAPKAQFIGAQIKEAQKDLFGAYTDYVELAEKRYLPADTWYRAGLISLYIGEATRAKDEFKKSGSPQSQQKIAEIDAQLQNNWDSLPPIPNSPEDTAVPNTATMTPNVPSSASPEYPTISATPETPAANPNPRAASASPLDRARMAVASGDLVGAIEFYGDIFKNGDPKVAVEYGAVLYRMGDLEEAKKIYDQALAKNSKDVELLRGRANTLERMYDREGSRDALKAAITDYKQAFALAPNHELLPWELDRAQSKN